MLDVLDAIWWTVTLPFRLVGWTVAMLGRLTGATLGFVLMVVGVALGAGMLFPIGIPLFLLGLLLTIKSLS